jgi:hypothetical protein
VLLPIGIYESFLSDTEGNRQQEGVRLEAIGVSRKNTKESGERE